MSQLPLTIDDVTRIAGKWPFFHSAQGTRGVDGIMYIALILEYYGAVSVKWDAETNEQHIREAYREHLQSIVRFEKEIHKAQINKWLNGRLNS